MSMDIESALDTWRYKQRLNEAMTYSKELMVEFSTGTIPSYPFHQRSYVPSKIRPTNIQTRQQLLELLQQHSKEYQLQDHQLTIDNFIVQDHVKSIQQINTNLKSKLHDALNQRRRLSSHSIKVRSPYIKKYGQHLQKNIKSLHHQLPKSIKFEDEIHELEDQLTAQRISRSNQEIEKHVYELYAKREVNVIQDEILYDLLLEITISEVKAEILRTRKRELPQDKLQQVQQVLDLNGNPNEILIQKYNVDMTRRHLLTLYPMQWLNDEVINFWFQLLMERDEKLVQEQILPCKSHFFTSFFYTKLSENGYNYVNVRRWTRKIDLFAQDKVFIPVNVSNTHWCLAVIFMTEKRIQYYDSMNGSGANCLQVLLKYLHDEMENKKKEKFDPVGWELATTAPDTPQQTNGSDCGVFCCTFADFISQNKLMTGVYQKDMEFYRHRMVYSIIKGSIPSDDEV